VIRAYRPREKACRVCGAIFTATRPMQHACGVDCALALARSKREKAEAKQAKADRAAKRAAKAAARAKLKTRADYLKDAQAAFNAWIRARDAGQPCISCGRMHQGQWHAGHYRTVGAHPELRFEPANVWKQCSPCNLHLSGNLIEYRKGLLQRIGAELLAWLEGPHEPRHYTIEELQALTAHYRAEARKLAKARSQAVAA
jgi:hypothetical protein